MRTLLTTTALVCALSWAVPAGPTAAAPTQANQQELIAVRAGTIHLVEGDAVLENGTLLIQGGTILAVGADLDVPLDARIVDFGPDAVVIPGLVSAYSTYATGRPSRRTASPGLRAVDGFDFFANFASGLMGGVTSAYVMPAEGRLVAGVGGVVKLAGDDPTQRSLNASAAVHGAIDATARRTRGYWEPPIPATVDVGIGFPEAQLPRTTSGAIVALGELLAAARSRSDSPYGPTAGQELAELVTAGVPWRLAATEEDEIRALLRFRRETGLPLMLDKAWAADDVAEEIAAAGVPVIFHMPFFANSSARDFGKGRDASPPDFSVPARLAARGVKVAIACSTPRDLLFSAALASRGGFDEAQALRAITLTPAELFGVADRVGSLAPGKDADFVVLSGAPLSGSAGVLDTWVGGVSRWDVASSGPRASAGASGLLASSSAAKAPPAPTVVHVEELHVGDGTVLQPGEVLLMNGRIAEVGPSVGRPRGARVVHGHAAMPGMIDALGHLGLDGSKKTPGSDYQLRRIVGPGDHVDRRVAAAGVTTVVLAPRGASREGAPMMAYKPAADGDEHQVVGDTVALHVDWTDKNRLQAGKNVRELLGKAAEYRTKWVEYEAAMAKWTPPAEAPEPEEAEDESEEDEDEASEDDKDDDDKKKKKKKGKKKKKELEPDPITGVWEASLERAPRPEPLPFKMRIELEPREGSGRVWGNLRSLAVAGTLVALEGHWDREERTLSLTGLGDQGWLELSAKLEDDGLVGSIAVGGREVELEAKRTSKDFVVAGRDSGKSDEEDEDDGEDKKAPKGKPKEPRRDAGLEPLRAAMEGRATVVVDVEREDEILDCVAAFEAAGILPVLYGASDAHLVAEELRGRVAGVLLSPRVLVREVERGTDMRTPYADLQAAGIPVAFHSAAEEGAVDLPLRASYAVANGMSRAGALRALTLDAARMFAIDDRVGRLANGMDGDVLLLDGPPLDPRTSVIGAWVNGAKIEEDEL